MHSPSGWTRVLDLRYPGLKRRTFFKYRHFSSILSAVNYRLMVTHIFVQRALHTSIQNWAANWREGGKRRKREDSYKEGKNLPLPFPSQKSEGGPPSFLTLAEGKNLPLHKLIAGQRRFTLTTPKNNTDKVNNSVAMCQTNKILSAMFSWWMGFCGGCY